MRRGTLGAMSRLGCLIAIACACGGGASAVAPQQRPLASPDYTATRWIPASPTYAMSARSFRDLQGVVTDVVDTLGIVFEVESSELSRAFVELIGVDPMKPEALVSIGIDVEGGIAVFSEAISPTVVMKLSGPDQLAGFIDQQRARGVATQSEIVGTVEVFTVKQHGLWISWAVDGEWLWVHFGLPFDRKRDASATAWFTNSHTPAAPRWENTWRSLEADRSKLAGFVDPNGVIARLPDAKEALACVALVAPIARIGFTAGDPKDAKIARAKFSFEIGPAPATAITAALLPPPDGWDTAARSSAVAVQWNLDVPRLVRWVGPCLKKGADLAFIERFGVRSARAIVASFDPDSKSGTGAVALDITSSRAFQALLDDVPLRSTFESDKRFGPWAGKSLSVPLLPTIEYVLTEQLALAGAGEGMLARAIGKGPGRGPAAAFALDVLPNGLSNEAWQYAFGMAKLRDPKRAAERLQRWRELHVTLIIEGTRLVFEAAGGRRSGGP